MTQMQLAEKLNITDRAISKWETGKSLPDSSIMLELCDVLGISVNDLLCGEVVTMDNYNKELENNLLQMIRQKEEKDKMLLRAEIIAGFLGLIPLAFATVFVAYNQDIEEWKRAVIVFSSIIPFLISMPFLLRIEQKAGVFAPGEICFADEIKSVPYPDEDGFQHASDFIHRKWIHPVRKDGFS